ncbi:MULTISPECIES: S1C family serine protease [unclassified Streptomyces]|uniref:S1C family serine protease n=1 Tax=unclassified Streptomyces TaxID=2593676 RepID=UPI00093BB120|nr:trypsin-like peptidase domain-containing protein [Streptomyces sp. TSRI0107]OKJ80413.1 signal protein PDZ [Streptomyces sp. TSRI0107]
MDASRRPLVRRAVLCLLPFVLLAGCSLAGSTSSSSSSSPSSPSAGRDLPDTEQAAVPGADDLESDYRKVIRDVLPSVVQIQAGDELGSGVVYDGKGHIVTNAHVVGDGKTFQVTTAGSETPLTAELVYSYPQQDLAVIRLERVPDGLKAARFGDSAEVGVGQIVLAMGSPLGLASSVTQGIVSATGRTVTEGGTGGGTGATLANMVQTSAAINPGNSGGALVDLRGEVVGIPTLAAADPRAGNAAAGIGFAIPASTVKAVAGQIVEQGRVTHSGRAALGITGRTLVDADYQAVGVAVVEVQRDGAADEAGIRPEDVITGLGDTDVTTITSLAEALAARQPGDRTTVTFRRGDAERTADVTLGEQ